MISMTKAWVLGLMLILSQSVLAEDRWLHIYGVSRHDHGSYREQNWGLGLEQRIDTQWSAALGTYQNSIYRTSVYAAAKYHWITGSTLKVNLNLGAITGYESLPVMPVVLPELCLGWVCSFVIPSVSSDQAGLIALYLRIPL